ncbi:unnamed protein product [Allacma fusca]|uniref:Uncharacterized protein n=1 Tax=Allacma fusca TaxID=39272 RepID=A0A8J2PAH8_9HEXA|nr:unnamed protein product [Allacma fusca]
MSEKRVSCSDFYEDVLGNKPVAGREMGIAEILEENANIKRNLPAFLNLLNLNSSPTLYDIFPDFVVKVTLMLRDWVAMYKRRANLGKLVEILKSGKHFNCAARIWKMFERSDHFDESWELEDERKSPVSITGQESKISLVLDNNPSFCMHVERLFLMLNLPLELFKVYTTQPIFMKNSNLILKVWKDMNEKNGTIQRLASIVAQNGHPYTAEKLRLLK